jgi:hypothetical protein
MAYQRKPKGIIKSSPVTATVAAPVLPATAVLLYQRTAGGTNPRTVIIRKIMAWNNIGADAILELGTGGLLAAPVFAQAIPPIRVLNGFDGEWGELDIPEVELGADITMECDQDDVLVQIEVEEIETRIE